MMEATKPAAATTAASTSDQTTTVVTMVAKYGKEKITLNDLPSVSTNVGHVKDLLRERTGILPKRQKLIGLKGQRKGSTVDDDTPLSDLKVKGGNNVAAVVHQFILMGTPEERIFVDPSEKEDLPDIIDDFDVDFNAGTEEVRCSG